MVQPESAVAKAPSEHQDCEHRSPAEEEEAVPLGQWQGQKVPYADLAHVTGVCSPEHREWAAEATNATSKASVVDASAWRA